MFQRLWLLCEAWGHAGRGKAVSALKGLTVQPGDDLEEARMGQIGVAEECSRQRKGLSKSPGGREEAPGRGWSGRALGGHLAPHPVSSWNAEPQWGS